MAKTGDAAAVPTGRPEDAGGATPAPPRLVTQGEIQMAAERLKGVVLRTPLLPAALPAASGDAPAAGDGGLSAPGAETGREIWLKCENLQHVSAFKVRGAYNFVAELPAARRRKGLVTFSSGNHAQGTAFAARAFGVDATIVMPEDAPRPKLEGTRALGARVEQVGTTTTERQARAEEIVRESGAAMVPPFDHPDIIAGQGTVGLELVDQLARRAKPTAGKGVAVPGLVLVPVGGGGLISGVAAAVKALVPGTRIVGVEPVGAASMRASLDAGRPVTLDKVDTLADGLKPVRPGEFTWLHVRELVEDVATVEDDEIRDAVLWLFRRRLVVEPSGAASVAALLSGRVDPAEEGHTVVILSGGNVDPWLYAEWLTATEA